MNTDEENFNERFIEVGERIYYWKAPSIETIESTNFLVSKLAKENATHGPFAIISDEGRFINKIVERMMSHLLGIKIRFFSHFSDALHYPSRNNLYCPPTG